MNVEARNQLLETLGARFQNPALLERALIHRSFASEANLESNERLEFLGDAVLGLVVCEWLCKTFPENNEGQLAKAKAYVVSETALAAASLQIGLDRCVVLSGGEEATGGRSRPSILSDAYEALIAALYLDQGLAEAQRVILFTLQEALQEAGSGRLQRDYKSALQEITQAQARKTPDYRIVQERGKDHDKTFVVAVSFEGAEMGMGEGKSKKEAEQAAAQAAWERLQGEGWTS